MRLAPTLLLCLVAGGCSFAGEITAIDADPPPAKAVLDAGLAAGIKDSHFDLPIEATDVYRAPSSSTAQWMACVRSAKSDEARRLSYAIFFGRTGYTSSRYSTYADNCASQPYHPQN
jgi:hypothetical protein